MEKEIKNDILHVLMETKEALEEKQFSNLKAISNHIIHDASTFQDSDSINTAILVYSLYKLFNSPNAAKNVKKTLEQINNAINALVEDDLRDFNDAYKKIYRNIELVKDLKNNINFVIHQAKIKKGSQTVYHGLSVERAADLFGISQWDLMNYLGKTNIYDSFESDVPVKKRLEYARTLK